VCGDQLGDHLCCQCLEGGRVSEEVGDADQQLSEEGLGLQRVSAHEGHVLGHVLGLGDGHPAFHSAAQGVGLVVREIVPGAVAQQMKHLEQLVRAAPCRHGVLDQRRVPKGTAHVAEELLGHVLGRQHVVDHAGGDGALRHAIVAG
jgi:hypothetical protein